MGVPADAWWSAEDKEWVAGARDPEGRLHGHVRYWRMDGTLVSECDLVHGLPSGLAKRFHESGEVAQSAHYLAGVLHGTRTLHASDGHTSERFHTGRISRKVLRAEIDYDNGMATAYRYFDREGRMVASDGAPLPERPGSVPVTAHRDANGDWIDGRWTETGKLVGKIRRWSAGGVLEVEEHHGDTEIQCTGFHDDGSKRLSFVLHDNVLTGEAIAWRRDGSLLRKAHIHDGRYSLEDYARDGTTVVRTADHDAATQPAPLEIPEADTKVIAALRTGATGILETATALTPIGMACAIAIGWGGDDDRDSSNARLARRFVRRLAPGSLAHHLDLLGFDRQPRILDAARAKRVVTELDHEPSVDSAALKEALVTEGATALELLDDPVRAAATVKKRVRERHLDLSHLGLERLPSALERFPDVTSLDASSNRLREIPVEIADMFRLHKLDLGRNAIRSVPTELAWLPDLRTLHLADNALTEIPSGVLSLSELAGLGLSDNQLRALPEAISDLVHIRTLWLSDNQLVDLPRSMTKLTKLLSLHLINHTWAEPPAIIGELTSLEELWLASPRLERLPAAICKLPRLRRLHLWYSALRELPPEIYSCTQLVELRIRENPLPDGTLDRLKEALPNCAII